MVATASPTCIDTQRKATAVINPASLHAHSTPANVFANGAGAAGRRGAARLTKSGTANAALAGGRAHTIKCGVERPVE